MEDMSAYYFLMEKLMMEKLVQDVVNAKKSILVQFLIW